MANIIPLSKKEIEAILLPQAGKRDVYHFKDYKGLQLRVTSSGVKTFSFLKRIKGGALERVTIGKFPDIQPEGVKSKYAKINAEVSNGASPNEASRILKGEQTLKELFEEYLERHVIPHGKKTIGDMRDNFRRYLSHWEKRKLSAITNDEVQRLHAKLGKENGHHTANRTLELLRAIFNKGISWGAFRKQNPAVGIAKFKLQSRDRFIQPDELPRFFQALADEPNQVIRDYIILSLLTGARQANVLEMKWEQISFERCEWRIPDTKNRTPQTITLSPEAIEVLLNRKPAESDDGAKPSPYVFPGSGKTGHFAEPKTGWRRILDRAELMQLEARIKAAGGDFKWPLLRSKKPKDKSRTTETFAQSLQRARQVAASMNIDTMGAKLTDLRIHDLRRTLGSWQARTGASLAIIGKSLNHKSASTTAIYARLDLDPVRESVERATSAIMTAAGLKEAAEVVKLNKQKRNA